MVGTKVKADCGTIVILMRYAPPLPLGALACKKYHFEAAGLRVSNLSEMISHVSAGVIDVAKDILGFAMALISYGALLRIRSYRMKFFKG
jgi:hypothetical protein